MFVDEGLSGLGHSYMMLHDFGARGMPYKRTYDTGSMAAKLGMIKILAPELVDLLFDLHDDLQDRDMEHQSGGTDWRECACGTEVARNACDGTGNYKDSPPHICALTALRDVLIASEL